MSLATAARTSVTHLGPPRSAAQLPDGVRTIAATLTEAGLPAEALDSADVVIWTKLALAGPMGPVTALLRRTVADVISNEQALALVTEMFDEILAVAHAPGSRSIARQPGHTPRRPGAPSARTRPRWRPTCSPGAVRRSTPSAARSLVSGPTRGETPVNRAVWQALKAVEATYDARCS